MKQIKSLNLQADDVYVVTYPKSGTHWLSWTIAQSIFTAKSIDYELNFFTLHGLVHDIMSSRHELPQKGFAGLPDMPRILKSHHNYSRSFKRVIWMVRDPRDVMASHYAYCLGNGTIDSSWSLTQFVVSKRFGINKWAEHTKSWLNARAEGQIVRMFRYEDLRGEPIATTRAIAKLLGVPLSIDQAASVVQQSDKRTMSAAEETSRSTFRLQNPNDRLVRLDRGVNRHNLSVEDLEIIRKSAGCLAERLGYRLDEAVAEPS